MPAKTTIRYTTLGAAIAGAAVAGAMLASPLISTAQETTTTTPQESTPTTAPAAGSTAVPGQGGYHQGRSQADFDPTKGGHVGDNGTAEELLTGDAATQATAAAEAAAPGGTVQRVETDAEGATYEAHVLTSDGNQVTVKMDADFVVTGVEDGPR